MARQEAENVQVPNLKNYENLFKKQEPLCKFINIEFSKDAPVSIEKLLQDEGFAPDHPVWEALKRDLEKKHVSDKWHKWIPTIVLYYVSRISN